MCYNLSMDVFTPLGIVIMSTLILAFLQLESGIFALFSHYARGKFSREKRARLTTFYMLGVETVVAFLFICSLLFVNLVFMYIFRPETSFLLWILVGILFALAIVSLVCYFRPGPGTQLFIPRKAAETLRRYARETDKRSDAFTLASVLELPFTLPLFLISAISIIELTTAWFPFLFLALLIILMPLLPLSLIRFKYRAGYNLADIMRARVQAKPLVRLLLCFAYTAIAVLFVVDFFI